MSKTSGGQPANKNQPSDKIEQRAGDRSTLIGKIVGDVDFKRVYQVLSTRSVVVILATVLMVATGSQYLYDLAQKPPRIRGDFNIGVAQFGEVTDQGGIAPSGLATQISKLLFDYLDSEFEATDFGLDIQVAHNKIPLLIENREARDLADDIDADLVIYGSIFVVGNEAQLSPRFYIGDLPDTTELTGQHELASPIQFDIPSLGDQDEVNAELRSRAAILVHFMKGLVFLSADNLDAASHSFQEAISEAKDDAEKRGPFEGQEVIYLVAAETYRLQENFEKANGNLDQALFLNPEYARAHLARGNIFYDQALRASFDESKLDQALAEYEKALEAQDHPEGAYIAEKVNTSLGNVYVVRAQQTNEPELFSQAIFHYEQVVDRYENTVKRWGFDSIGITLSDDRRLREMAASAYFGLGAAYERQMDYSQAVEAYRQCIDLTGDSDLKSRAKNQLQIVESQR